MINAGCKLPWSTTNVALFKDDRAWNSDWRDTTVSIADWVGQSFSGTLPSWTGIDGALELPWSTSNVAFFHGDQVWHSDWPASHETGIRDWAREQFTGSLPSSWSSIDAGCKLPWSTKNVALFKDDRAWNSDWRDTTVSIADWVGRSFSGTLPSWTSIDGVLQLPWSASNVAFFKGDQVWHSDWPASNVMNIRDWARAYFTGSLPSSWTH